MSTVVCGIGNRMRGDDAAGPAVIDKLRNRMSAMLMDCGEAPESFLGKIEKANPERVIIIDAVRMARPPGTVEIIDMEKIRGIVMSSHNIPLTLFLEYLRTRLKAEIIFLGIQPRHTGFNQSMSGECEKAVDEAAEMVLELCK